MVASARQVDILSFKTPAERRAYVLLFKRSEKERVAVKVITRQSTSENWEQVGQQRWKGVTAGWAMRCKIADAQSALVDEDWQR